MRRTMSTLHMQQNTSTAMSLLLQFLLNTGFIRRAVSDAGKRGRKRCRTIQTLLPSIPRHS
jgi:hypothetical protein